MQYKSERVELLLKNAQEALDTTKPDPKEFGTVSHTAALEHQRRSEQDATTRHQRALRTAESLKASQSLKANDSKDRGRS